MCQLTKLWRPSCYSGSKLIGSPETTQFDWSSQIDRVVWVLINNENRGLTLTSPKWVTFYGFRDLSYLIWKITSTWSDLTCSTLHLHLYVYCMCTVLDLIIDLDQLYSYCFGLTIGIMHGIPAMVYSPYSPRLSPCGLWSLTQLELWLMIN